MNRSIFVFSENLCLLKVKGSGLMISGLRTFRKMKNEYSTENYVVYNLFTKKRSLCTQLRFGILPLAVLNIEEEKHICSVCFPNDTENDFFCFVLFCTVCFVGNCTKKMKNENKKQADVSNVNDAHSLTWWEKRKKAFYWEYL